VNTDEHGRPTSHGKPKIGVVIDLESMGAGGRMLMFQCNSYRVARLYGQVALQPYGTVIAHELFEALLWRVAASNFKTYLDHGPKGLVGFDNAYIERGDVYHTIHDDSLHIPDHTIYHAGYTLLAFIRGVDTTDEGDHFGLHGAELQPHDGGAVFFDFLHVFWICYTASTVRILHTAVGVAGAAMSLQSFASLPQFGSAVAFEMCTLLQAIVASGAVGVSLIHSTECGSHLSHKALLPHTGAVHVSSPYALVLDAHIVVRWRWRHGARDGSVCPPRTNRLHAPSGCSR
jgi:hypothetical protein